MAALQKLPVSDAQRDQAAYDRWLDAYPFHPDLISVLYQKWTQMNGFQRTRGALRLLAYALRDSEGHDPSPVVGHRPAPSAWSFWQYWRFISSSMNWLKYAMKVNAGPLF